MRVYSDLSITSLSHSSVYLIVFSYLYLLIIAETTKTRFHLKPNFEPTATVAVEWPRFRIVLFSDFNGCCISDSLKYQPVVHTRVYLRIWKRKQFCNNLYRIYIIVIYRVRQYIIMLSIL